jgi:DNA-binding transcriptional MerR regulator
MTYKLIVRSRDEEPAYTRPMAAHLAQVSIEFLYLCEEEDLIRAQVMPGGGRAYSLVDIRHLARIRRLREDLGLDLPAVEVVINLRLRVLDLMAQMDEVERRAAQREQELIDEIRLLRRRLAQEAEWRW